LPDVFRKIRTLTPSARNIPKGLRNNLAVRAFWGREVAASFPPREGKMAQVSFETRPSKTEDNLSARHSPLRRFETIQELQSGKIRQVRDALVATGYLRLDAQARVLGLPRSTAWSILQAKHKRVGVSAAVIKRMLDQPLLPPLVRVRILEYVKEKSSGAYGHTRAQRRRFAAAIELERQWCMSTTGEETP
jgi:hypothetical protein